MTENERELLYAIRDATDDGRIKWDLANDGQEFHANLKGQLAFDYLAVMYRDEKFIIDIRDSSGKFIDSIKPSVVIDRAVAQYVYSIAHSSTSRTDEIFSDIIEALERHKGE